MILFHKKGDRNGHNNYITVCLLAISSTAIVKRLSSWVKVLGLFMRIMLHLGEIVPHGSASDDD